MTSKLRRKPIKQKRGAKTVEVSALKHPVYYRATQVGLSAPCHQTPALQVGMRVAVLETRNEFRLKIPTPKFYEAKVSEIRGDLVHLEYKNHPYSTGLIAGMAEIAKFCVPLDKAAPPRRGDGEAAPSSEKNEETKP